MKSENSELGRAEINPRKKQLNWEKGCCDIIIRYQPADETYSTNALNALSDMEYN